MQMIQPKSEECDHIKFLIEEKDSEEETFYEDLDGFEENGTQETRISPYSFCKAFPFHLMFDKELMLTQCGNAIYRVLPQVWIILFLQTVVEVSTLLSIRFVYSSEIQHKTRLFDTQNVAIVNCIDYTIQCHVTDICISYFIPQLQPGTCILPSVFSLVRPHIDFSFHGILSHINTVFVLRSKVAIDMSFMLFVGVWLTNNFF